MAIIAVLADMIVHIFGVLDAVLIKETGDGLFTSRTLNCLTY